MTVSRRDFVCRAGAVLAGASIAPLAAGCAGAVAYRVTPVSGELRLDLSTIPELQVEAGVAQLQVDGEEAPLFIVRQNVQVYHTLSSVCTHQGCTVEAKRTRFECPCHGSVYSRMGDVMRGPAERALRRYPTTLLPNGRTLVINFRAATG
jgi:cytochrome b6-f complex iron-sulfur subunit